MVLIGIALVLTLGYMPVGWFMDVKEAGSHVERKQAKKREEPEPTIAELQITIAQMQAQIAQLENKVKALEADKTIGTVKTVLEGKATTDVKDAFQELNRNNSSQNVQNVQDYLVKYLEHYKSLVLTHKQHFAASKDPKQLDFIKDIALTAVKFLILTTVARGFAEEQSGRAQKGSEPFQQAKALYVLATKNLPDKQLEQFVDQLRSGKGSECYQAYLNKTKDLRYQNYTFSGSAPTVSKLNIRYNKHKAELIEIIMDVISPRLGDIYLQNDLNSLKIS